MSKLYDVEVVIEHRYVIRANGNSDIEAGHNALVWAMDNEQLIIAEDLDGRISSVKEHEV